MVEAFNIELTKELFKPMNGQGLENPGKISAIWCEKLNSIVSKISNTKSLMTGINPKDATELGVVELD